MRRNIAAQVAIALLGAGLLAAALPGRAADDEMSMNARLLASVRNEDSAGVERALRDGAAVNARNRLGESALLVALKKNRADIAQVLLAAGADVNRAGDRTASRR